jgi:hypothetical protein
MLPLIASERIKYIGITLSMKDLYNENYKTSTKENLKDTFKWRDYC